MDKEATIAKAGSMAFEGAGPEQVIPLLRQAGFNQLESILALRRVFAMTVSDAKEALIKSVAWSDSVERWNEAAEQATKLLAAEQKTA